MKSSALLLLLSMPFSLFAQDTFQLAPPLVRYNSVFFSTKTKVEIEFAQTQTAVHYTLSNTEPTTADQRYSRPLRIKYNFTTLKAKSFGNNFRSSETVGVTFIKDGKTIQVVEQTAPHVKYAGNGVGTLIDNKGGLTQLSSNTWMGYDCDTVSLLLTLSKQQKVSKVLLNFLQNQSAWIFLPEEVVVKWYSKKLSSFQPFGEFKLVDEKETNGSNCSYQIIETGSNVTTNQIAITIRVKKNIPSWHPGKGQHGWMFVDEIKVY